MNSAPPRSPLNEALKSLIVSATGKPASVASPPIDLSTGEQLPYPYTVIYPMIGGGYSGARFCGGTEDATWHYQMTVYGERDDQTGWLMDKVRQAIIGRDEFYRYTYTLDYPPGKVLLRDPIGGAGELYREGEVFRGNEDYVISVTTKA